MSITTLISAFLSIFYQVCSYAHDDGSMEWFAYKLLGALFLISMFITYEISENKK